MFTALQTDDRNERVSADTDAKEEPEETTQQGDRQEYEAMDIPEHWLPLPLFLVRPFSLSIASSLYLIYLRIRAI